MAWIDKPTESQLGALWGLIQWQMPRAEAKDAIDWLKENANRRQVSEELGRIRDLAIRKSLNREQCFSGEVWAEYFNSKVGKE